VSKRSAAIAGTLGALGAAAVLWAIAHRGSPLAARPVSPPVTTAIVRAGWVDETLEATGRAGSTAGVPAKLSFAVAGTVRDVVVQIGERVSAGTPLANVDATPYRLAAEQAGADARAAAAGVALAAIDRVSVRLRVDRENLERERRLYAAGIVAQRDVASAQATLAADAADARSARDALAQARDQSRSAAARADAAAYDLSRTTLRAPVAGVVSAIYVQPGSAVDPSTPAIALAGESGQATLDVAAADLARVRAGDAVRVRANGGAFAARVSGVSAAVDPATGLATVGIDGVPASLAAGTPLEATIVVGEARGLVVPQSAVIEDPQSGRSLVFVETKAAGGNVAFAARDVIVDVRGDGLVRVTSGLHAGERIAATGAVDLLAPSGAGD